jgi:hypothetical protein
MVLSYGTQVRDLLGELELAYDNLSDASTNIHSLSILFSTQNSDSVSKRLGQVREALGHYAYVSQAIKYCNDGKYDDYINLEKQLQSIQAAILFFKQAKTADAHLYMLKYTQCLKQVVKHLEESIVQAKENEEFLRFSALFSLAVRGINEYDYFP